jgi:hypothetical protein
MVHAGTISKGEADDSFLLTNRSAAASSAKLQRSGIGHKATASDVREAGGKGYNTKGFWCEAPPELVRKKSSIDSGRSPPKHSESKVIKWRKFQDRDES